MVDVSANSVDLITCAQGAHWLDRDKFYAEARRVLKTKGVVCFYGYGIPTLDEPEGADLLFKVQGLGQFGLTKMEENNKQMSWVWTLVGCWSNCLSGSSSNSCDTNNFSVPCFCESICSCLF